MKSHEHIRSLLLRHKAALRRCAPFGVEGVRIREPRGGTELVAREREVGVATKRLLRTHLQVYARARVFEALLAFP